MIFFTRTLQDGIQDDSGWSRRAERTWHRNRQIYKTCFDAISPILPRSVVRLCRETLHDAVIESIVQQSGTLTFVTEEPTRGNYPRSFNFDPTGNFLYSCNQRGDNITTFRVDQKSGTLAFTGQFTPVGNPSIIVFLDLAKTGK